MRVQVLFAPGGELCYQIIEMANGTKAAAAAQESFGGRFYPQELLNSGGMADIWLVTDSRGKPFALRRLKDSLRFNLRARRRFMRGCDVLQKLTDSEFIISYVEHGKLDRTLFLLMDYIEAENLKALYARQDPVLTDNVAQILIDMAAGLGEVHECGFMHLDFKPENVLITRNGKVRLIDFDMAQPLPEKPKKMSDNPGTPGYMAPEQLQRKPIDGRVDIWAYGVAAYELMTNHKPFPGETPGDILASQLEPSAPIPLSEHNPAIPPELERIILKCLAREPDRRYPTTGVLVRELQDALYV